MRWGLFLWAGAIMIAGALLFGCSKKQGCSPRVVSADQKCSTTKDCVDAGYKGLSCVNGACAIPCLADSDCSLTNLDDSDTDVCKDQQAGNKQSFICEAELCARGCPDVPCGANESCVHGRCAVFFESFEIPMGKDFVTLQGLGWNDIHTMLENRRTKIVSAGSMGCSRGIDQCAGPAAEGVQYVSLESAPTPAFGMGTVGVTCRACACCLQCQFTPTSTVTPDLAQCPNPRLDGLEMVCPAQAPPRCRNVCSACDSCQASQAMAGDGLLVCERQAANKTCSGCGPYNACLTQQQSAHHCSDEHDSCHRATMADCNECIAGLCASLRAPCYACRDAEQCELMTPGSQACIELRQRCIAQGADGCSTATLERKRSQLFDEEQALVSKAINLSGLTGKLVLQLEYVPFDVGEQYRRVIQGMPRSTWPLEKQEVLVQLCGGSCEMAASWVDAKLTSGQVASVPPANQRRNGLHFADQSIIDWNSNRVEIEIPNELRTTGFRVRFLPRLDDQARVGIDNILIRRRP